MRSERKVPARKGEHDGERRGRASRMLDKVRRTDGSVRQPPGPGSTGATGTPLPLVRGLNAGVILRRRTGRNPRARPVIGAEDRNREGLYPTADLRRAETMKAKFFYTGIRVKDLEASVKFYTTLLGMKVRGRNSIDAAKGTVVELVCEGEGANTLELTTTTRAARSTQPTRSERGWTISPSRSTTSTPHSWRRRRRGIR